MISALLVALLAAAQTGCGGKEPPTEPHVIIDPDVFAYQEDLGYSLETFVVTGAERPEAVREALDRAGTRFMLVDETGVEHPDVDAAAAAYESGLYTPNYVSAAEVTAQGVRMYVDCKGSIEDPMALAFHEILRQELGRTGLRLHVRAVT